MSNPLIDILAAAKTMLENSTVEFNQVEYHEGQLEDIENVLISPPSAFLELSLGTNEKENYLQIDQDLDIYLCAPHMKGDNPTAMYDMLWTVICLFHGTTLAGYWIYFNTFERGLIFPGFCVYRASFKIKYEPGA